MTHHNATFFRNAEFVNELIESYKAQRLDFKVHHAKYSTIIEIGKNKMRYCTQTYKNKVFQCSSRIQGELNRNPEIATFLDGSYSTLNFGSKAGLIPGKYGKSINMDISGAYPQCLLNHKLISKQTFDFLMNLDKKERLPAIGMIAKKKMIYVYKNGELDDVEEHNGKYQKIFFFIVAEINRIMNECVKIAGNYYIMHWVDGIFLEEKTPRRLIRYIEQVFKDNKYPYKFEPVEYLNITRDDLHLEIDMIKKDVRKQFRFIDNNIVNLYNSIAEKLNNDASELLPNMEGNISFPSDSEIAFYQDFVA
mgnify:CR=1 FL=1|jgi:hypothetical protein